LRIGHARRCAVQIRSQRGREIGFALARASWFGINVT
jgi:hypothetical protein